ncbi:hypothetical protein LFX25_04525 [Leptospira sp. FAT2]|uniref:hypothetical protein n=1 Tax=Leptospira sanjuanensis TaxID=2879643 RepID=UPI001EE7FAF1|nr:hypothetical protein [Leptospira sanjuanensis]MCG6192500.1 hypothetical protein [Leptospira sanjuanensis]
MNLPEIDFRKRISGNTILFLFVLSLYAFLFYHGAWLSDDSFITFRVVDNFLNGFGIRWNPLERVQVYTHPLWLFLLIPIEWVVRDIDLTGYLLSYVCGVLFLSVYWFVFTRWKRGILGVAIGIGIFFSSRTFVDYNSSGLENPLSFLLLLLFQIKFYAIYSDRKFAVLRNTNYESIRSRNASLPDVSFRSNVGNEAQTESATDSNSIKTDSFEIGLLTGLLALTRLDLLLFLILPWLLLFGRIFRGRRIPFLVYSVLGMLPWVAYLIFSWIYFGSFFPNTFYAKTNVLSNLVERISAGWDYLRISLKWDPIAGVVFAVHLFWIVVDPILNLLSRFVSLNKKSWAPEWNRQEKGILAIAFGEIAIVFVYLLWVGGDFMAGRFLGTCLIVSVFAQSLVWLPRTADTNRKNVKTIGTIAAFICVYFLSVPTSPLHYAFRRVPVRVEKGVVDERASYQDNVSLKGRLHGMKSDSHPWAQYAIGIARSNAQTDFQELQRVQITTNVGLAGYYGGPGIHWIDLLGITDPFLARLPGKGFPGHYIRLLPQGYKEYVEETAASLPNAELDRLYYEVRLLSEEDLWTRERWKTIFDFALFGKGNFKTRFPAGFSYPFVSESYRKTLYGIPFSNMNDEELNKRLAGEYFGTR